jgi:hypothetical protein
MHGHHCNSWIKKGKVSLTHPMVGITVEMLLSDRTELRSRVSRANDVREDPSQPKLDENHFVQEKFRELFLNQFKKGKAFNK